MALPVLPSLLDIGRDCLRLVIQSVQAFGGNVSMLRPVCKAFCHCIDSSRSRLLVNPAMMQQDITLERFGIGQVQPRRPGSAVLRALRKWAHIPCLVAFGHLLAPWIPQLVSLAIAEGELPLLQGLFLQKLAWRHSDAGVAQSILHTARITFVAECIIQRGMPAAEAMPMLRAEVHDFSACLKAWTEELDEGADWTQHMAYSHVNYTQWLLWALCSVLTYRGEYQQAEALIYMQLQPWEYADAVRTAWGRETLVLVQLARQQYQGAVNSLVTAPCWAQVAAVGRRLAKALGFARQRRLQRTVMDFLACCQKLEPDALPAWRRTLEEQGGRAMMSWGQVGSLELGASLAYNNVNSVTGGEGREEAGDEAAGSTNDRKLAAAHAQLAQRAADFVQLLAVGKREEAVAVFMEPVFDPLTLDEAENLIHVHLLQSLGVHDYSVPTPEQQRELQGLVRALWAAVRRDPKHAGRSGRAHVLLSYIAWQSLNAGRLGDALAAGEPQAQLVPLELRAKSAGQPAAPADGVPAPLLRASFSDAESIGTWQWGAATPAAEPAARHGHGNHSVVLPTACGLAEHTAGLLGLNLDFSRGVCGYLGNHWCRQEMSLQAAAAAPGQPPAYTLHPPSMQLVQRMLATPCYAYLRTTLDHQPAPKAAAEADRDLALGFQRIYATNDLLAGVVAATAAGDSSLALALSASCFNLQQKTYAHCDGEAVSRYCADAGFTRAALLAMYGQPGAASELLQAVSGRCGESAIGSLLAYDVVEAVKATAVMVGSDGIEWRHRHYPQAECSSSESSDERSDRASRLVDEGPEPPARVAHGSAATTLHDLVAQLPRSGALWRRPEDEISACAEALGQLLLLQPGGEADGSSAEPGAFPAVLQQLLRRVLWAGAQEEGPNAPPPAWAVCHFQVVPLMLRRWEDSPVREDAFLRLMELLPAVLLPRWPRELASLLGGALECSPQWSVRPALFPAWTHWWGPSGSDEHLECWRAFAHTFCQRVGEEVELPIGVNDTLRMMGVLAAAPASAWGAQVEDADKEDEDSDVGFFDMLMRDDLCPLVSWMLECLVASWAEEPHGRAALDGRGWCLSMLLHAHQSRRNEPNGGRMLAEAMAMAFAQRARQKGMRDLAEAVWAQVRSMTGRCSAAP